MTFCDKSILATYCGNPSCRLCEKAMDERIAADKKTNNKRWELFKRSGDGKPCKFCGKPSFYRLSEYGYYCRQCHSEESAEPEQKRVEETWTEKEGAKDSLDESVYGGKVFEGGPKDQETGEGRLLFTGETANVSFEASEAIKAANKDQKRSELEEGWNDQAQGNVSQEPKEREQCEWRAKGYPSCSCRICRPRIHYPNVTTGCCANPKCNPDQETEERPDLDMKKLYTGDLIHGRVECWPKEQLDRIEEKIDRILGKAALDHPAGQHEYLLLHDKQSFHFLKLLCPYCKRKLLNLLKPYLKP